MILLKSLMNSNMCKKINYPSAERNKFYILEVLQKHIDPKIPGKLLEIASGTGQQCVYFASKFPKILFQPSEIEDQMFDSIKAYAVEAISKNVKNPVKIDVNTDPCQWGIDFDYDYVLNVNMFHVTPISCSIGFFKNCSKILKSNGLLFTYGPYANNGVLTPQSNIDFDKHIRQRDPNCGVRDIQDLRHYANECGIILQIIYDLPANNKCLVWKKEVK
ncbi:methyltransferase-like 26 isoform X2 [Sitophilus oryzae]|nr:methyltransferase-like 26 isoform X2 [Sitophilus oryzae]